MSKIVKKRKRSGGVKTSAGKEVTKYNAQKHGILRDGMTEYEVANYEEMMNSFMIDFQPKTFIEEKLIETLATNFLRLQRISRAEADTIKEAVSPLQMTEYAMQKAALNDEPTKSYVTPITDEIAKRLEVFSRYQTASENRIHRTIIMLKKLKYE